MIRFYKNTELPDFQKAGYFKNMGFAIHEMAANDPSQFLIYAEGSSNAITSFKHLILDSLGDEIDNVVLDTAFIQLIAGNYICNWADLASPLTNGFGQFEVKNGVYTWLSEPFRISDDNAIVSELGDFNNDFDYSYNSD